MEGYSGGRGLMLISLIVTGVVLSIAGAVVWAIWELI